MGKGYLPASDSDLREWADPFSAQINAAPLDFGVTVPIATELATATSSYADALALARAENTRTKGTVAAKNTARDELKVQIRKVVALVQAHPEITPLQLSNLGLTVRDKEPSPVLPPALAPLCVPRGVVGSVARFALQDALAPGTRRRPANAIGATVLSYVGEDPPPPGDVSWKLEGQSGRTTVVVAFPAALPPGTVCWVTAMWYNARGESSPPCEPVKTILQLGAYTEAA